MKEMKESEIKYYRNNFFHFGDGDFLEDFLLLLLELFFPFFFFYITSQRLKDKPKNWLEGKSSGSILILLQIYFRFISQQTLQFYTSNKAGMPIWIKLSCNCP